MKRMIAAVSALLLVAGCSSLSGVKPESINQSFYLAYALVESAYDSIEIAIMGGQIKTAEQARSLKKPVDESKAALDEARRLYDLGQDFDMSVFTSTRQTLLLLQKTLVALGAEDTRPTLEPVPEGT